MVERPKKSETIAVRVSPELRQKIKEKMIELQRDSQYHTVSEAEAVRALIEEALRIKRRR